MRNRKILITAGIVAILLFDLIQKAYPESFLSNLHHANAFIKSGEYEKAIEELMKLQIDFPESQEILFNLGYAYLQLAKQVAEQKKFEEAENYYQKAISYFQNAAKGRNPLATQSAHYNEANAIAKNGLILAEKGAIPEAIEKMKSAIQKYEELLQNNPNHKNASHNLDCISYQLKKLLQTPPPPQNNQDQSQQSQKGSSSNDQKNNQTASDQDKNLENEQGQQSSEKENQEQKDLSSELQRKSKHDEQDKIESENRNLNNIPVILDEDSLGHENMEKTESPQRLDSQSIDAILQSLQEIDQREQKQLREVPLRERPRKEWW